VPKLFSFRFDVDTHRCVRDGMPALSALGQELKAPFTFFVNMGRAVSIPEMFARLSGRRGTGQPTAAKYSARRKLGWRGYLEAAVLNPRVGAGFPSALRDAVEMGHEVGLHGGINHARWQVEAAEWSEARFVEEVDGALAALVDATGGVAPLGFASPGWTTSAVLPDILRVRGFSYLADAHGFVERSDAVLANVPTQLTGEPGGVAYLEHLRAAGLDDDAVTDRFLADLTRAGDRVVVYDHPYYAGIADLEMVRRLVTLARGEGYEVVRMADQVEVAGP
jgi:peptidoglycan/xylan/chitin deacetylase (PgdA/CDA1 family)